MARTAQISKDKKQQSIITLRHEGQSIQKVSLRSVTKTIKRYDETSLMYTTTGKENPEFIRVNFISDCSPNKCLTVFK
jgi:hypothetical protein